jgi:hypothetical protein
MVAATVRCGSRTSVDAIDGRRSDAGDARSDAGDARSDASDGIGEANDAPITCAIDEATTRDPTVGVPVYFNGGNSLAPGTYEVEYVDGCMKYSGGQGWTVNAYDPPECCNWWIIGETTSDRKIEPPGAVGFLVGAGAYENFEDCVTASKMAPPRRFAHTGGKLGIWLQDIPYTDNIKGIDGRNPKWRLTRIPCVDGGPP